MIVRLAKNSDLPKLEKMFLAIVENMNNQNIKIWNQYYPYEEFENDIKNNCLYILESNNEIIATFGLFESISGQEYIDWTNKNAKAIYLARVGVNVNYLRKGIGSKLINYAKNISKQKQYEVLRLTVAEINTPAINLYLKNGFIKQNGKYIEYSPTLEKNITEFGFELNIQN